MDGSNNCIEAINVNYIFLAVALTSLVTASISFFVFHKFSKRADLNSTELKSSATSCSAGENGAPNGAKKKKAEIITISEGTVKRRKSLDAKPVQIIPKRRISVTGESLEVFIGVDEDDWAAQDIKKVDEQLISNIKSLDESLLLLRRTRAVTVMANRLMLAENETKCYEEVSRLLVVLFKVERSSYTLMTDEDHFTVLQCSVQKEDFAQELGVDLVETGLRFPLKGTGIEYCAKNLETLYTPVGKESPYIDHKKLVSVGLNSFLNTPILVAGKKFAGCLNIGSDKEHDFTDHDITLIQDIASTLGTHIYSKRLQLAQEGSHKASKDLLHSLIPPVVLSKIEHYWAEHSEDLKTPSTIPSTPDPARAEYEAKIEVKERYNQIRGKLAMLEDLGGDGVSADFTRPTLIRRKSIRSLMDNPTNASDCRALFAEEASNVSIIFTDIVGFSRISLNISPLKVMDMLQDLFLRFDGLCAKHGIFKFETIGDAYLCAAGIFDSSEEDADDPDGKKAARRALAMAKDMVREARKVVIPKPTIEEKVGKRASAFNQCLQIRAGVHVGDCTYGVLGKNIPKLTLFGNAVNMAARMEQTSLPGKIHVTSEFHDLVDIQESEWEERRFVSIKNMGEVETYLMDPVYKRMERD